MLGPAPSGGEEEGREDKREDGDGKEDVGNEDEKIGGPEPARGKESGIAVDGVVKDIAGKEKTGCEECREHADPVGPEIFATDMVESDDNGAGT